MNNTCTAITKSGKQCTRKTHGENGLCFQHKPTVECVVCLQSVPSTQQHTFKQCGHNEFCKACIRKWLQENNTCPICREIVADHRRPPQVHPLPIYVLDVTSQITGRTRRYTTVYIEGDEENLSQLLEQTRNQPGVANVVSVLLYV